MPRSLCRSAAVHRIKSATTWLMPVRRDHTLVIEGKSRWEFVLETLLGLRGVGRDKCSGCSRISVTNVAHVRELLAIADAIDERHSSGANKR